MATTEAETPKKTFTGSCHCKYITYKVAIPDSELQNPTAGRCNCTICLKQGWTSLRLPRSDFTLLTPSSLSECKDYRIHPEQNVHKYFCGTCGVHVVGEGAFEWKGQMHEFFQINLVTLDQPQEGLDLSQFKMRYVDGRNNKWDVVRGHEEGPHSGGVV